MFLPDESTLAGRLAKLVSAAELGLLVAEYQQKQQKRRRRQKGSKAGDGTSEIIFEHAPRFVGSDPGSDFLDGATILDLNRQGVDLGLVDDEGRRGSLSALAFAILFENEFSRFGTRTRSITVCLHCFGVFWRPWWYKRDEFFCSKECSQAAAQALQRARRQNTRQRYYIRFGLWDAETEMSIDTQRCTYEPGISAYHAFYDPEDGCYRLDYAKAKKYERRARISLPFVYDRQIFIITGKETKRGIDREPCVCNIRLIAPAIWRNQQIVPLPLERLLAVAEVLGFGADT